MDDKQIIELFFERDEKAIAAASEKYSELCGAIAYNILGSTEDRDEAVNDAWLRAWGSIPPESPKSLAAYLTTVTRNIALDMYRKKYSAKRAGNLNSIAQNELAQILPADTDIESQLEKRELLQKINCFLGTLSKKQRILFVRRYYFLDSIKDISQRYGLSESYITVNLTRIRKKLAKYLEREGLI